MADFYSVDGSRINPATGRNWTEAEWKSRPSYVARKERIRQAKLRHAEEFADNAARPNNTGPPANTTAQHHQSGPVVPPPANNPGARSPASPPTRPCSYRGPATLKDVAAELMRGGETADHVINNITSWSGRPLATRESFLDVLENWESSLPLQQLWMVFFKVPPIVRDDVMGAWGEHILRQQGGVDIARKRVHDDHRLQTLIGCAFAQSVRIPPEQTSIDFVGPNNRGFLKAPLVSQRQQFASLNIEFLESNISFVDFLIRPWTVLTQHYGLVARDDIQIGTDILLVNFGRAGVDLQPTDYKGAGADGMAVKNNRGMIPRKMWLFQNCVPINIANERYSYTNDTSPDRRDTEWNFRRYQVMLPNFYPSKMDEIDEKQPDEAKKLWNDTNAAAGIGKKYQKVREFKDINIENQQGRKATDEDPKTLTPTKDYPKAKGFKSIKIENQQDRKATDEDPKTLTPTKDYPKAKWPTHPKFGKPIDADSAVSREAPTAATNPALDPETFGVGDDTEGVGYPGGRVAVIPGPDYARPHEDAIDGLGPPGPKIKIPKPSGRWPGRQPKNIPGIGTLPWPF